MDMTIELSEIDCDMTWYITLVEERYEVVHNFEKIRM